MQRDVIDYRRGKTASLCIGRDSERRRSLGYVQSGVQVIFDIGAAVLGITSKPKTTLFAQPTSAHAHGETNRPPFGSEGLYWKTTSPSRNERVRNVSAYLFAGQLAKHSSYFFRARRSISSLVAFLPDRFGDLFEIL